MVPAGGSGFDSSGLEFVGFAVAVERHGQPVPFEAVADCAVDAVHHGEGVDLHVVVVVDEHLGVVRGQCLVVDCSIHLSITDDCLNLRAKEQTLGQVAEEERFYAKAITHEPQTTLALVP